MICFKIIFSMRARLQHKFSGNQFFAQVVGMRPRIRFCALLLPVLLSMSAAAADPHAPATVTFTLDFPGANPSHYEIGIGSDGSGSYRSNGQLEQQAEPADPEPLRFELSDRVRRQIFELAQKAHYFTGKIDSGRKNIANTGVKTLAYNEAQRNTQATYIYSSVGPVQQLTEVLQGLSATLEFGRRIKYFLKYEKLALDADLKRMEELQKERNLGDVQAIAAVLNEVAADQSIMNVTRARARRVLASGNK